MRTFLAALAAVALSAAPALAQGDNKADAAASAPMDMSKMTPEQMHAHCAMLMGAKMQGAPKHDHSAEKHGGMAATNKPTDAQMKAMHEKCAAMMSEPKKP